VARIAFVTYEIHPTTWGGAGVLLRHAAEKLLAEGHEIRFLLDVPAAYYQRFEQVDRKELPAAHRCRSYHVDALCADLPLRPEEVGNPFLWKSLRFDHALARVEEQEPLDFVEFFEYCGVAYHALVARIFGVRHRDTVIGVRTHNSVELIDLHESTKPLDRERHLLHALERASLPLAETVLVPSMAYAEAYYLERYGLDPRGVVESEPRLVPLGARPELPEAERDEVVYYGRIFEFKGVERFVRAALLLLEERPDSRLRFVLIGPDARESPDGGGSYRRYLERSIPARHRERFEFTGHLDHEAVRQRLGRTRFAVFPNRFESFCYALHEVYEAGVPVLLADIPAFRHRFRHEQDALFFDGTTGDLAAGMRRLDEDDALRRRLSCPAPLPRDPLGPFYAAPEARLPAAPAGDDGPAPDVLVAVLVPAGTADAELAHTLDAVRRSTAAGDRVRVLRELAPEEDDGAGSLPWLGRLRRIENADGARLPPLDERTLDALWIVVAGDEPEPAHLKLARRALARRPSLGFAGGWTRDADGTLRPETFDVAPELYPFEHGERPTRALLRTRRGVLLTELFDVRLGGLGEIDYLWQCEETFGPGVLLPAARLRTAHAPPAPARPEQLAFLVTARAGPRRLARLAALSLVGPGADHRWETPRPSPPPTLEAGLEVAARRAARELNGRTLARLAAGKLLEKLGLRGRRG